MFSSPYCLICTLLFLPLFHLSLSLSHYLSLSLSLSLTISLFALSLSLSLSNPEFRTHRDHVDDPEAFTFSELEGCVPGLSLPASAAPGVGYQVCARAAQCERSEIPIFRDSDIQRWNVDHARMNTLNQSLP